MPLGPRPVAAFAALMLACLAAAVPATAAERPPRLVAQIAQATPEATPEQQPELSEEPPTELSGGDDEQAAEEPDAEEPATTQGGKRARSRALPDTGSDAGMLALVGFSLMGWGFALRLRLRDAA